MPQPIAAQIRQALAQAHPPFAVEAVFAQTPPAELQPIFGEVPNACIVTIMAIDSADVVKFRTGGMSADLPADYLALRE